MTRSFHPWETLSWTLNAALLNAWLRQMTVTRRSEKTFIRRPFLPPSRARAPRPLWVKYVLTACEVNMNVMSADSHHLQWVIRATFLQGRFCLCAKWWQISGIMPWRHTSASLIRVTCVSKKIVSAHLERKCMGACKSAALLETNNNKFIFGLAFHGFVGCKPHQKPSLMPFFFPPLPLFCARDKAGKLKAAHYSIFAHGAL